MSGKCTSTRVDAVDVDDSELAWLQAGERGGWTWMGEWMREHILRAQQHSQMSICNIA